MEDSLAVTVMELLQQIIVFIDIVSSLDACSSSPMAEDSHITSKVLQINLLQELHAFSFTFGGVWVSAEPKIMSPGIIFTCF